MPHKIILTNWQTHSADLISIRTKVFIQEQQVPVTEEWDGLDEQALHFLTLTANGEVIGCARLLLETSSGTSLYHIGRVAILTPFRNKGIGRQLMQYVVAYCKQTEPENNIYLHAQTKRCEFYKALGFIAEGTEFMDAGIPHICMYLAS